MDHAPPSALDLVDRVVVDRAGVPKGPSGLWGALAAPCAPAVGERDLPALDTTEVAPVASMFDYDDAVATPLVD